MRGTNHDQGIPAVDAVVSPDMASTASSFARESGPHMHAVSALTCSSLKINSVMKIQVEGP